MENAFKPGDPVLELAALGGQEPTNILEQDEEHWVPRPEQAKIDAIISGTDRGHYYLMVGEKGTGKSSMLLDAMQKVDGEGVSVSAMLRYFIFFAQWFWYAPVDSLLRTYHGSLSFSSRKELLTSQSISGSKHMPILRSSASDSEKRSTSNSMRITLVVSLASADLATQPPFWTSSVLSISSRKLL